MITELLSEKVTLQMIIHTTITKVIFLLMEKWILNLSPEDKNYELGRFDFHNKSNKIDESSSPIKITVEHYEMLKRNHNPNNSFAYPSKWIPL